MQPGKSGPVLGQGDGFVDVVRLGLGNPDGAPRKLLDVSKLKGLGWEAKTSLADGMADVYEWYLENVV